MIIQDRTAHLGKHGPIICTLLIAIVLNVSDDVQLVHCVILSMEVSIDGGRTRCHFFLYQKLKEILTKLGIVEPF